MGMFPKLSTSSKTNLFSVPRLMKLLLFSVTTVFPLKTRYLSFVATNFFKFFIVCLFFVFFPFLSLAIFSLLSHQQSNEKKTKKKQNVFKKKIFKNSWKNKNLYI